MTIDSVQEELAAARTERSLEFWRLVEAVASEPSHSGILALLRRFYEAGIFGNAVFVPVEHVFAWLCFLIEEDETTLQVGLVLPIASRDEFAVLLQWPSDRSPAEILLDIENEITRKHMLDGRPEWIISASLFEKLAATAAVGVHSALGAPPESIQIPRYPIPHVPELIPVVALAEGPWVITSFGLQSIERSYPIEEGRLGEGDWVVHMAQKSWVNVDDFSASLSSARILFEWLHAKSATREREPSPDSVLDADVFDEVMDSEGEDGPPDENAIVFSPAHVVDTVCHGPGESSTPIDLAILTVLREEHEEVARVFGPGAHLLGTSKQPNEFAWSLHSIPSRGGGNYRVVLGRTVRPTNSISQSAAERTLAVWKPRYLVWVGVCGGIQRPGKKESPRLDDVIVATRVQGYEYGKIDVSFSPRADFGYDVDGPLLVSLLATQMTGPFSCVHSGLIICGDKVIDNLSSQFSSEVLRKYPESLAVEMEAVGAAHAMRAAMARNAQTGFGVIRGVSDLPKSGETTESSGTQARDSHKRSATRNAALLLRQALATRWPVAPLAGGDDIGT